MLTTDTGVELPEEMQKPHIQRYFLQKYPEYKDLPFPLIRELLLLPNGSPEERDRTDQIWRFCTGLPLPDEGRLRTMHDMQGTWDRFARESFHESPASRGTDLRGAMKGQSSSHSRPGLAVDDLDSANKGSLVEGEGEAGEIDPDTQRQVDRDFRNAVRKA
jgi:hypothetical protein